MNCVCKQEETSVFGIICEKEGCGIKAQKKSPYYLNVHKKQYKSNCNIHECQINILREF